MNFSTDFQEIVNLTGLEFDEDIKIEYDEHAIKQKIQILIDAGIYPDDILYEFLNEKTAKQLHDMIEKNRKKEIRQFPENFSIIDILGEYFPDKKKIMIYRRMCYITARALNVVPDILEFVVLIHEISHAVTHLGQEPNGRIWEYFGMASSSDKELFAQIYPLLLFKKINNKEALNIFYRLSNHQDEIYNLWQEYENRSLSEINEALIKARHKIYTRDDFIRNIFGGHRWEGKLPSIRLPSIRKMDGPSYFPMKEREDRISIDGGEDPNTNVIPSSSKGVCCKQLLVKCYFRHDFDEAIRAMLFHAGITCRGINGRIAFITTAWVTDTVIEYSHEIEALRRDGVDIFFVLVTSNSAIEVY